MPVALEIHREAVRPDAVGRFFRERLKTVSYNGWMAVTPNGKVLNNEPYLEIVVEKGLAVWDALPEGERKPGMALEDLGAADPDYTLAPSAGTVILKSYIRSLRRNEQGGVYAPKTIDLHNAGAQPIAAQPQRDHLWIREDEAAVLGCASAKKGAAVAVPASLVRRLLRFCLKDSSTCIPGGPYRAEEVSGKLDLIVGIPSGKEVRASIFAEAVAGGVPFRFRGAVVYDSGARAFRRLDLLAWSETGHEDKETRKTHPLAIAFELGRPELAIDRVAPYFLTIDRWKERRASLLEAYLGTSK